MCLYADDMIVHWEINYISEHAILQEDLDTVWMDNYLVNGLQYL